MSDRSEVKISVLARMSGVPAATIKHYLREGLLPPPKRTSRNMAYYDVALVPRIQRIKQLQRTRFLPLEVIRDVLDAPESASPDETVSAAVARVLAHERTEDRRTRAELEQAGVPKEQLTWLERAGVVRARREGGNDVFEGHDLELLRVLGAARKAGLAPEMLPVEILAEYAQAVQALVRAELRLFREGVVPRAGGDLAELTEAATTLSERLVIVLRRKMLVPTLEAMRAERDEAPPKEERAPKGAQRTASKKTASKKTPPRKRAPRR